MENHNENYLYDLHNKITDYIDNYCNVLKDCADCKYYHFKNCDVMLTIKYLNDKGILK